MNIAGKVFQMQGALAIEFYKEIRNQHRTVPLSIKITFQHPHLGIDWGWYKQAEQDKANRQKGY